MNGYSFDIAIFKQWVDALAPIGTFLVAAYGVKLARARWGVDRRALDTEAERARIDGMQAKIAEIPEPQKLGRYMGTRSLNKWEMRQQVQTFVRARQMDGIPQYTLSEEVAKLVRAAEEAFKDREAATDGLLFFEGFREFREYVVPRHHRWRRFRAWCGRKYRGLKKAS